MKEQSIQIFRFSKKQQVEKNNKEMRCSYIFVWFPLQVSFICGACGGLTAWTSLRSSGGVVALRTVTYMSLSPPEPLPELLVPINRYGRGRQ